jgi:alpha-beta hydrolase superfamily lysophospholipase
MTIEVRSTRGEYRAKRLEEDLYYLRYSNQKYSESELQVFFFYGFGEHLERYSYFADSLIQHFYNNKINLEVIVIDYPGHGKSSGARGHLSSFDDLALDFNHFILQHARGDYLLMGKGLGALCVLQMFQDPYMLFDNRPKGGVLINPALKVKWKIPKFLEKLNIEGIGTFGKVRMPFRVDEAHVVDIGKGESSFDDDPLVSHHPTLSSFAQVQKAGHRLRTASYYIDEPIFMAIKDKENHLFDNRISELFCRGLGQGALHQYSNYSYDNDVANAMTDPMIEDILNWYKVSFT